MQQDSFSDIHSFFVAGVNYKKSDAITRGMFAINHEQYAAIINSASEYNIAEFFVLSTCNRTEIYGFAPSAAALTALLCSQTEGSQETFKNISYIKQGREAITHLFSVAAGLDSQILGDYEIVGQIKMAVRFSKDQNCIGPFIERMINEVLQASKKIRTHTALSSGIISVSFAAVQFIKTNIPSNSNNKILVVGTGKIGSNLCKNLVDYLPGADITIINRNHQKALALSTRLQVNVDTMDKIQQCIDEAGIVIVATNASSPILFKENFNLNTQKLVIDLSIPNNVEKEVGRLNHVTMIGVDELSKIKDETLQKRAAEIPKVAGIIEGQIQDFFEWYEMRRNVPVLKHIKYQLSSLGNENLFQSPPADCNLPHDHKSNEVLIQKVINGVAVKMQTQNHRGCMCIEAMRDFILTATN
jgi:glutamyl-tRNA reductase